MHYIFCGCKIDKLPDISNWNISKVSTISNMFSGLERLEKLPDISKWDTSNVTDMSFLFNKCTYLDSLPDISKMGYFKSY